MILLAAGASSRLGRAKQLLDYNGQSFLKHMISTVESAGLTSLIVVLGANASSLSAEADGKHIDVVINTGWQEGIASSIRCGIIAMQNRYPACDGALIIVCDQPYITVDLRNQLIRVQKKSGKPIAASAYEKIAGTPAIFHQSFFTQLASLQGDKGAGKILKQVPDSIATIDFPLGSFDIDTQEDYDNWKANLIPHKAGENEET